MLTLAMILREEMVTYGVIGKELAAAACLAPSTLSEYLTGSRPIPKDREGELVEVLNSPRASEERCTDCKGNLFPTRYLDEIDNHPIVALDKLVEEAEEIINVAKEARKTMINKRHGYKFAGTNDLTITSFEDEVADLITCSKTLLIKLQEWYNRPVVETMRRHIKKLEQSGYCSVKRKSPLCKVD
ncbi:hypothetical protein [Sporomusa paucivorans]|uniref:hypothetical protein n=1 Tax=Sporomusa paucivorans TaxID=2376 RepID=UPI003570FC9A